MTDLRKKPMNILLIEDAVVVRAYLEKYLRELSHEVTSCADAETALHTYQQTFYPLIILDLGLPGMDGFEFCRRIQTLPHRERSMILVITADDDLKTLQKALDVGVDDYLIKPVKIDQLHIRLMIIERQWQNLIERKQVEETLLQLRKAVETMQLGVTITTPDGHILYTNPADAVMHGYTSEELIGQDVRMFAPAELRNPMSLGQIENLKGWARESLNIRKDGSCFPVLLRSDIVKDADGKTFAIVTTCEDITKRKQAEEELRQAHEELEQRVKERTAELLATNKMLQQEIAEHKRTAEELQQAKELAEAANQAKSVFLANMSHELRTPLNAILGYAQILKNAENLSDRQIEALTIVKRSGEHLLNMINDILDLSKIEAGRLDIRIGELDLPKFLESIADMIWIQAQQKGLIFQYEGNSDLPRGVRTDEKRLREVLINLLSNAVKFTEKGSVTFRVKRMGSRGDREMGRWGDGEMGRTAPQLPNSSTPQLPISPPPQLLNSPSLHLLFEVEDTGVGIAPEHLEEIFLPFRQVDEQPTIEGTGLGLSISRQIVEAMGGKLSVQSTIGKGSLFWFEIDFPEILGFTPKSLPCKPKIQGYRGKRQAVLVTDDRPENRAVLVDMLLPLGFHLLEAENGQECVDKALQHRPDVILLDIRMPVMDGFEAARRLRSLEEVRDITIIAVSASVFEERRKQILEAGCDAYLAKPFEVEDLLHVLQRHLHLEWVYAENIGEPMDMNTPEDLQPGQFAELPSDHVNNLIAFAERGSLTKILAELDAIECLNAEYAPTVQQLRRLTKRFQFEKIITFLKHETD